MTAKPIVGHFHALILLILLTVFPGMAQAVPSCREALAMPGISLLQAVEHDLLDDTTSSVVRLQSIDLPNLVAHYPLSYRPDFELVILRSSTEEVILGLVAKGADGLLNQQVVQWQQLDLAPWQILGVRDQTSDGAVSISVRKMSAFGVLREVAFRTHIVLAKNLEIEARSRRDLIDYLKSNPRDEYAPRKCLASAVVRYLFGRAWVSIFGDRGQINAFNDSRALLNESRLVVPGKVKHLHVVGQIFTSDLNIDVPSPYSGILAPGHYYVLGRLSSSMKNLDIKNANDEVEPNSLAIALLLFRTPDQSEQPGLLFIQDSLLPVQNPGLTRYQLSNNPGFKFRPKTIREFFEQGFTVAGVGLSSLLNVRDSGRGVEGNFRSTYGAAASGVDLGEGQAIAGPRYLALQYTGKLDSKAKTEVESISADPSGRFIVRVSEDGKNWRDIGAMENLNFLGIDSHELTFPHGLAGTINPQTLRPASSTAGIRGLELPSEILPDRAP